MMHSFSSPGGITLQTVWDGDVRRHIEEAMPLESVGHMSRLNHAWHDIANMADMRARYEPTRLFRAFLERTQDALVPLLEHELFKDRVRFRPYLFEWKGKPHLDVYIVSSANGRMMEPILRLKRCRAEEGGGVQAIIMETSALYVWGIAEGVLPAHYDARDWCTVCFRTLDPNDKSGAYMDERGYALQSEHSYIQHVIAPAYENGIAEALITFLRRVFAAF